MTAAELDFDRIVAEVADRVRGENADRYVDLRLAVELADTRTGVVEEKDGMVEVYSLRASDWNRVVAVTRGHVSQKTRQSLDRFLDRVTAESMRGSLVDVRPERRS